MTTPAQDAPLVFPSVAFRPVRLFFHQRWTGRSGDVGRRRVRSPDGRDVLGSRVAAGFAQCPAGAAFGRVDHRQRAPVKTVDGPQLGIAPGDYHHPRADHRLHFRPAGLGVVFGLAFFQVLLVATTALPVLKKLRTATEEPVATYSSNGQTGGSEGRSASDD